MISCGSTLRLVFLALIGLLTCRASADDGAPISLGASTASIIVLEFSDYQCPYCQRFYETTFQELKKTYIDSGIVLFSTRDNPLPAHRLARAAAHSARCAHEQGHYWDFRLALFKSADRMESSTFENLAQSLSLNTAAFKACMDAGKHFDDVDRDSATAETAGITGRPTFLVARKIDNILSGERIVGAQPYSTFVSVIELVRNKRD